MISFMKLRELTKRTVFVVSILLVAAMSGVAQTTTSLSGTIVDNTGAVIPAASVTAINDETHQAYSSKSNAEGSYLISDLPIGQYTVRASVTGFKTTEKTGVQLRPSQATQLNFVIAVGDGQVGEIHLKIKTSRGTSVVVATVDVSAVATGATWHGTSDSNGEYQLTEMPCVDYDVQVNAPNSKPFKRRIHVHPGAAQITSVVLQ